MDVRFVTSNAGKVREVQRLLAGTGIRLRQDRRSLPEPQADRLEPVVRAKLAAVPRATEAILVEDSGLFLPSLGGFPGVYSAYIYRIWGCGPLLELLRSRDRSATFQAVAGVRTRAGIRLFTGACKGTIARSPRGEGGFGFDPIFRPTGSLRTFAEMEPDEKNRYSHRALAMRQAVRYLLSLPHDRRYRRPGGRARRESKGTKRAAR